MLAYLFAVLELFSQGRAPVATGLRGSDNAAAQCESCHPEEYAEWRASRHSQAWSNDFFQFDYRQEKRQWCRNCHIPLVAQQQGDDAALALRSEGVTCVTCHVRDRVFLARRKRADSPHDTKAMAGFGGDLFCAGCHQFNFPIFGDHGELRGFTEEPMQDTVGQFRAGPYAASHTCRDCHASSPAGHAYAGSHDLGMLQRALAFSWCRAGGQITTTLENRGAGHNVPTGDVHRHVLIKAWRSNAPEKLQQAFYGRRFAPLLTGGKTTTWDSTLPPKQPRRWHLDAETLGAGDADPINVEVVYVYGGRESYRPPFAEPAAQVVYRVRLPLSALAPCVADPAPRPNPIDPR